MGREGGELAWWESRRARRAQWRSPWFEYWLHLERLSLERVVADLEEDAQAVRHLGLGRVVAGQRRLVGHRLQALDLPVLEVVEQILAASATDARLDRAIHNEVHYLWQRAYQQRASTPHRND